jgi:tRNA(fMet)-specific endonuclease VapC
LKRFVLDTGIASDLINGRLGVPENFLRETQQGGRVGIPTVALGELWGGIEYSTTRQRNRELAMKQLARLTVWPFDREAAEEFGRIYAELRSKGRPIQQIDMQIAAVALTLGNAVVVTKDSDFLAIDRLQIVDWSVR